MNRREFLATGAALSIAATGGCTGCAASPTASLSMESVTDEDIARHVASTLEADSDNRRYALVRETVENGSATRKATRPLVSEGNPVVYDGGVYDIHYEVVETIPATTFSITLNPVDSDPDPAEIVSYDALPEVDRQKFAERGWDGEFLGFGTGLLYLDSEIPQSALVPEPEQPVIEWPDGTQGRFTVDDSYDDPLKTYRYTSETLYESAARLGAMLRERHAFTLGGLGAAERKIVEQATGGPEESYVVPPDEEPPEAMRQLATRFRDREEVRHLSERDDNSAESDGHEERRASGSYLVRYEGKVYWTELWIEELTLTSTG